MNVGTLKARNEKKFLRHIWIHNDLSFFFQRLKREYVVFIRMN